MPAIAINGNWVNTTLWVPNPAIISKSGNVRINGQAIVVEGDIIPTHTRPNEPHASPTMIASQSTVRVNGQSVIINGDRASCDATHVVIADSGNVTIRSGVVNSALVFPVSVGN